MAKGIHTSEFAEAFLAVTKCLDHLAEDVAPDTADAMAHLRESCAIAAGKAPMPTMTDMFTGEDRQVTCWQTGEETRCLLCGDRCPVLTNGHTEWVSCLSCETVTGIP